LGALFFTVVITHASFGFGVNRLLGGIAFCLGLILVVVAGAELFTGNNLVAMAWASRRVSTAGVVRNWVIVYVGNVVGCFATVMLVLWGDIAGLGGGAVRETAVNIASVKAGLSVGEAFARGILCNALVCLAVWLAMGGRTVTDKIMAILFPIAGGIPRRCRQESDERESWEHPRWNRARGGRVLGRLPATGARAGSQIAMTSAVGLRLNAAASRYYEEYTTRFSIR
jgi:hypothetical protein